MNKYFLIFLSLLLLLYTGCSNKDKSQNSENASSEMKNVDVDLTILSSTMVYAEVFNIMSKPDSYLGKTIKLNGLFYSSYYDENETMYYYVVITDAASCCPQGLEFVINGERKYPEDYPDERSKIEVTGTFSSYNEYGETYYHLLVEDLRIL